MSTKSKLLQVANVEADLILENRKLAALALASFNQLRGQLEQIETNIRALLAPEQLEKKPLHREALEKLLTRLERIRELRNMMEIGALEIQVNRAMEDLWRELP